jgi:heptosyltransferase-2/heptosyltransferase-3
MGDMVLLTPLIRSLSCRYGTAVDIVASGPWTVPLLQGQPGVGEIHLLRNRKLPYLLNRASQSLVATLRARGPTPTWYCDTDNRCLPLLRRAGIADEHVVKIRDVPLLDSEHVVDYWQRFARLTPEQGSEGVLADAVDTNPTLEVPVAERAALDAWLAARGLSDRPVLLLQPGNKRTMRGGLRRRPSNTKWWPESRWAALVQELAELHPEAAILLMGVAREQGLNDEIMALAGVRNVHNVACDLPIPRMLALMERAVAMVSVDTGPAHAAAAVGCPVVVLFGTADPRRLCPRGRGPVLHLAGVKDRAPSILGITVDQVIAAWERLPKRWAASMALESRV